MDPICTSFVIQSDGSTTHSVSKYLSEYQRLRESCKNLIVLFLDESISPHRFEHPMTVIKPITINNLPYYSLFHKSPDRIIYAADNPAKNTAGFHTIMNSKLPLALQAAAFLKADRISWVDFGIGHVIKDEKSFEKLHKTAKLQEGLIFPGCWPHKTNHLNPVSWRFCGGFFHSDVKSLKILYERCDEIIVKIMPHITWEVNVWAIAESTGINIKWYKADHNDTVFDFDQYLVSSS